MHNSIIKELGENTDYKITGIKHVVGANFRYEYEINAKGAHIKAVEDKGKVWYINASNVSQNMSNSLKSKILDSINQDKFSFKYNIDVDADSTINAIMPNEVYININITECIEEEYVNVAVPQFCCGLSRSSADRVTYKVYTKPFVYAPVSIGQQVGTVEYFYNNELIHTSHIISLGSVGIKQYSPSFSERFADAFKTLFKWFV